LKQSGVEREGRVTVFFQTAQQFFEQLAFKQILGADVAYSLGYKSDEYTSKSRKLMP
jgi:hypothetical protein